MTEKSIIKQKYSSMHEAELIAFAAEEGSGLTEEALQLLRAELKIRNLDSLIIEKIAAERLSPDSIENTSEKKFSSASWNYVFDEKETGKSNEEILSGLIETGLSENNALSLLSMVEIKANEELKKADLEKLTGGLLFISGLAITFLPLSPTSNRLLYILAGCMILYGTGKFIKGLYYRGKFKKIIENLGIENSR